MAIIRSVAIGKAAKSIGNVTMRTVRGRTIASEKVGSRPATRSGSAAQQERTAGFSLLSRFAKMHAGSIGVSFTRTQYGSPRNAFVKRNYAIMFPFLLDLATSAGSPDLVTDAQIEAAVTAYATANPGEIVRIHLQGQTTVYLSGAWSTVPDPAPVDPGNMYILDSVGVNGSNISLKSTSPGVAFNGQDFAAVELVGNAMTKVSSVRLATNAGATSWASVTKSSATKTKWSGDGILSGGTPVNVYAVEIVADGVTTIHYFA